MPTIPKQTKCAQLGCKEERSKANQFCTLHGGKNAYTAKKSKERLEFNNAYNDPAWKRIRARQLSTQPICQACHLQGRITPANQVDHLFPWNHLGQDAFWFNIFQSLCAECHTRKGWLEDKGTIRHYTPQGAKDYDLAQWKSVVLTHYQTLDAVA